MTIRFQRRSGRRLVGLVLLLAIVGLRLWQTRSSSPAPQDLSEGLYQVQRVVDGDTLLLSNGARVRLLGIDTPETVKPDHPVEPWGPEATAFAREMIGSDPVRIQMDRERKDVHGRFLAFVWCGDRLLNEALVREGLARAMLRFPYSSTMKRRLQAAEDEAKAARRGIWSQ